MNLLNNKNTIALAGKEWRLSPLTVADLGELQDWVFAKLPDPIKVAKEIAAGLPTDQAREILLAAYEDVREGARRLGSPEATKVLLTFEGFRELLFLHGRRNHPDMSRDDWERVLVEAVEQDLEDLREKLGEDEGGAIPDPKAPSSSALADDPSTGEFISITSHEGSDGRQTLYVG